MRRFGGLTIILFLLALWLPACGSSSTEERPAEDGDTESVLDGDAEPDPDGDERELEVETDAESEDADSESEETIEEADLADPDESEFIPTEYDTDEEAGCENGADAACFANAPGGSSGTKCQGDKLLSCAPTEPRPPACSSVCRCTETTSCAYGCLDSAEEGMAACASEPEDGDLDADDDSDTQEITDADSDSDEALETDEDSENLADGDLDEDTEEADELADTDTESDSEDEEPSCLPDAKEPNDTFTSRQPLDLGISPDFSICAGDADWFAVALAPGETLNAKLVYATGGPVLALYLYDTHMTSVAQGGAPSGSSVSLGYTSVSGGDYALLVFAYNYDDESTYRLELSIPIPEDGDATETDVDTEADSDSDSDTSDTDTDTDSDADSDTDTTPFCLDDANEPNDACEVGSIVSLTPGTTFSLPYQTICPGNKDWVRFSASQYDTIQIDVAYERSQGDLDLSIYGPCDSFISHYATYSYQSAIGGLHTSFGATHDGVYGIRIGGALAKTRAVYSLSLTRLSLEACGDAFDPNSKALPALPGSGSFEDLALCTGEDWYRFDLEAGQALDLRLGFDPSLADINATLYAADGLTVLKDSATATSHERLIYNASAAETVLVRVYTNGLAAPYYHMTTLVAQGPLCEEDDYEPNNTPNQATFIEPGLLPGLALCGDMNEEDWYRLVLGKSWSFAADFLYDADSMPMQISLLDIDQTVLAYSSIASGGARIETRIPEAGTYFLRLRRFQAAYLPYEIDIAVCEEDAYDNHLLETAASLSEVPTGATLTICGGNDDYFSSWLYAGQKLTVTVSHSVSNGNLDLHLYNGTGAEVASSTGTTSLETVIYTAPLTTTYFIRVTGVNGVENGYKLYYTIE